MKLKKKKQKHSENKKPISYSEAKPSTEEDVLFEQMYGKPLNREDVEKEKNKKRPKKIKKEDGKKVKAVKRNTEEKTEKMGKIKLAQRCANNFLIKKCQFVENFKEI